MLPTFISHEGLPKTQEGVVAALRDNLVRKIRCYVLGPGVISNIPRACQQWLENSGLLAKADIIDCPTPEGRVAERSLYKKLMRINKSSSNLVNFR